MTKRDITGSDVNGDDDFALILIELDRLRDALDEALANGDDETARQLFMTVNQLVSEIDQFASDGSLIRDGSSQESK